MFSLIFDRGLWCLFMFTLQALRMVYSGCPCPLISIISCVVNGVCCFLRFERRLPSLPSESWNVYHKEHATFSKRDFFSYKNPDRQTSFIFHSLCLLIMPPIGAAEALYFPVVRPWVCASVRACFMLAWYLRTQWTEFHQSLVDDVVKATARRSD